MAAARREEIVRLAVRTRRANPQSEQRNTPGRRSALTKPVRWQRGQLIASKGIGGGHSAVAGDSQVGRLSEVQKLDGSVSASYEADRSGWSRRIHNVRKYADSDEAGRGLRSEAGRGSDGKTMQLV